MRCYNTSADVGAIAPKCLQTQKSVSHGEIRKAHIATMQMFCTLCQHSLGRKFWRRISS